MADAGVEVRPPMLKPDNALFLDFDGTIAAFAQHPDGVELDAGVPALLGKLRARLDGAVALVTGRSLAALDAVSGLATYPGAGLHGLELRFQAGPATSSASPGAANRIVERLRAQFGSDPRVVVEDKGAAVALHWRQAPERAEECIAAMRAAVTTPEFEILPGHSVVEARPRGTKKGAAIAVLARHGSFVGRRPVFVGDDLTDEDGFRAVAALGGHGIKVGSGATAARYRIDDVEGVHAWLAASIASLEAGAGR